MSDSIEIIPTVVPQHAGDFADAVEIVRTFAPYIHLDIDDGIFTNGFTWPYIAPDVLSTVPLMFSSLPVEVHLMVKLPEDVGNSFIASGAKRLVAHVETFESVEHGTRVLTQWRSHDVELGLALLLDTPIETIEPYIPLCDFVVVMSIATIGQQGAAFDPRALQRISQLRARYPRLLIAADGGVSMGSIADLARVGARRFVVGSAIMKNANPKTAYTTLMSAAMAALN